MEEFICAVVCIVCAIALIHGCSSNWQNKQNQIEACKQDVAKFIVNPTNGVTTFEWIKCK